MSSKQHEVQHLTDQPWYDYDNCLRATAGIDRSWRFLIGAIFQVKIPGSLGEEPVHEFYALKVAEGGEPKDRYRMCLYIRPLVAQRALRGLEEPPKKPPRRPDSPYLAKGNIKSYVI